MLKKSIFPHSCLLCGQGGDSSALCTVFINKCFNKKKQTQNKPCIFLQFIINLWISSNSEILSVCFNATNWISSLLSIPTQYVNSYSNTYLPNNMITFSTDSQIRLTRWSKTVIFNLFLLVKERNNFII